MDKIDSQIVALLRKNARRSFQDIGAHVSLSAPAVKRRVDRLQETGVIRGYAAVVDPSKLGWNTLAGESAAVLLLRARDTTHLERTLEQIREPAGVIRTQTQVVLSTVIERPLHST